MKKESLLKSLLIVLAMSFFSVLALAQAKTVGTYKKVTVAPANGDWSGQYLVVNESESGGPYIWDCSLASCGYLATFVKNYCVISTTDGTIEVTQDAVDKLSTTNSGFGIGESGLFHLTIDADNRLIVGEDLYCIGLAASNNANTGNSTKAKVDVATADYFYHTISLDANGAAVIKSTNGTKIRQLLWYKTNKKFGYYTAGTNYVSVYLYKLVTDEGGEEGGETALAAPTASVESGDYLDPFDLTLACATEGATIKYKVNGGEEQTYSAPIRISATTTLVAWAEKEGAKSEEVTFTYNLPATVANLAAFIADESGNNVRIASTMTVVYCKTSYLYVKDESGYMLVNGKVNSKNPSYKVGDQFTGLVGIAKVVNGIKEITPANFPTATATGVAVEPEVVAMKNITTGIAHKYIVLEEEATFVSKTTIGPIVVTIEGKEYTMPDRFTLFVNGWKFVAGDMLKITAFVGFDANGNVELYPIAIEKVEGETPETPTIPDAPAAPAIQYPDGGYFAADMLPVAVTTTAKNATVLVTIDGTEPTATNTLKEVQLTSTATVKARTMLMTEEGKPYQTPDGAYLYSDVVSATFTKVEAPAAPVFTPAAGDYYDSVIVSIACATKNVKVQYEFGGAEPTGKSATYTEPFKLTTATVVSAMAFLTDEKGTLIFDVAEMPIASPATRAEYKVTPYVAPEAPATPTIQYEGGYFASEALDVALTTKETRPNNILVTVDGSEPLFGATATQTLSSVKISATTTIKVRAILMTEEGQPYQTPAGDYIYSDVVTATFTKVEAPAAPVFTPAAGDYYDSVIVSIACATKNVKVQYEFGGAEPTGKSATYTEPFKLTTATVVSAMAFLTDEKGTLIFDVAEMPIASPATRAEYKVTPYVAPAAPAAPALQYPDGGYFTNDMLPVALTTTETRPNSILVTMNGIEPSFEAVKSGAANAFSSGQAIQLTATSTIKLRGMLMTEDGKPYQTPAGAYIYSDVVTATFTKVEAPAAPVFTPAAGDYYDSVIVSIACATENVMIKYAFGGTEPTGKSTTYTEPFKLTENTVVSAMALLTDAEGALIIDVENMPIASAAVFAEYVIKETILPPVAPVFSPEAGEFIDSVVVTLACETENTVILYDLLGLQPNFTSPRFEEPIIIKETTTIAAMAVLVDEEGEVILNEEEMPYMSELVTATYVVKPGEVVGVDNIELVAVVYTKGGMIYVDTELGNMIEVFTVQGQCIYSAEATAELTSIDAINADVLLVKVNDQVIKVAIK